MSAKLYNVTIGDTAKSVTLEYNEDLNVYTATIDGITYSCSGTKISSDGATKVYNVSVDGENNTVSVTKTDENQYDVDLNGTEYSVSAISEDVPDPEPEPTAPTGGSDDTPTEEETEPTAPTGGSDETPTEEEPVETIDETP